MNELRELMDRAAGEAVALSDAELREFARRGRQTVRRRRFAAATGAVAVSAALATGWALLPSAPFAAPDPVGPVISPAMPTLPSGVSPPPSVITPPPSPKVPVPLVADGIRRRNSNGNSLSSLVCGLKPKGWTVEAVRVGDYGDPTPDGPDMLTMKDPRHSRDPHEFGKIDVMIDRFAGDAKIVPKTADRWDDVEHYQAGPYQATVNNPGKGRLPMSASGQRDMFLRVGDDTLLHVWTVAPRLGWDLRTALRFAGSCRIVD